MTTPEEAAAQAALDEAIDAFLRAEGHTGIMTQYVLVTHSVLPPSDDGSGRSAYNLAFRGGEANDHEALGLLDYARESIKQSLWRKFAEEDE